MAQYIDKDALVAEIERRLEERQDVRDEAMWNDDYWPESNFCIRDNEDEELLTIINTLEVKDVDFEKKKIEWIEQLCKYFKANYLYVSGHESFISEFRRYAKNLK